MLEILQAEASKHEGWSQFGQYCAWRIKGDRKTALNHLKTFTSSARKWKFSQRKDFTIWLLEHLEPYPITSQCPALEEPFVSDVLDPTLRSWCSDGENTDARPFRWLGMFFQDGSTEKNLARAIEIDPHEQLARTALLGKIFERSWDGAASMDRDLALLLIAGIEDEPTRHYWSGLMGKRLI